MLVRRVLTAVLAALAMIATAAPVSAQAGPRQFTGTIHGVPFAVEIPAGWNGTLLLWSHGYGEPAPLPEPTLAGALLDHGYALAGTAFPDLPWASRDAVVDQLALLDWFAANVGHPRRTVAIGQSVGGQVTTVLAERHPGRFSAALPMCGPVAGGVGWYNGMFDIAFALKTLLWPDSAVQIAHIADPEANLTLASGLLREALSTPAGQARLALANAFGDVPGWADSLAPRPSDPGEAVVHQYLYDRYQIGTFLFGAARALAEERLGGNPSWNLGVDYARQLASSSQRDEVAELYRRAGLDLGADLATLAGAPRVAPEPHAVAGLARDASTFGLPSVPTLTMHTTGDGTTVVEAERWYGDRAAALGRSGNLRQTFVDRGNHCFFTVAEMLAGVRAVQQRMDTGSWGDTSPAALNAVANSYGPGYRQMWSYYSEGTATVDGAFQTIRPGRFPRPFPF